MKTVSPFSNQYLISTTEISSPVENWLSISLDGATLHYAPNLSITESTKEGQRVLLLGFAFHVLQPDWNEQEILESFPSIDKDILDYLDLLCGIHLIIVIKDGKTQLFHDAAAVMKMFKLEENNQLKAVASDPNLLQQCFPLAKDDSSEANAFYTSAFFLNTGIRIGKLTQYSQVEQILPNHSLHLNTGEVARYFPRKKKVDLEVTKALEDVHTYFTNVIKAADRKYDIKCSMTAGWDSRMLLAMTKDFHDSIEYYTFELPSFDHKHEDYKIPKMMSETLGLNHSFGSKNIQLDDASKKAVKSSFKLLETEKIDTYLGGFPKYMDDKNILLVGTVSEICKNYYDNVDITSGASFAKAAHFPVIPYTTTYFESKLAELKQLQSLYGYDLRDIAHWEQDITNFAAKRTLYLYSFVRAFSPFNARIIIQTILSVPRKLRDKQQHEFYGLYLEKYYPELLQFPVNPSLKQKLIRLGKKVGLYGAYKKISTQLRK